MYTHRKMMEAVDMGIQAGYQVIRRTFPRV